MTRRCVESTRTFKSPKSIHQAVLWKKYDSSSRKMNVHSECVRKKNAAQRASGVHDMYLDVTLMQIVKQ